MTRTTFRDRALELRGFIKGYLEDASLYKRGPHTTAMLSFLDDFLQADAGHNTGVANHQRESTPLSTHSEPFDLSSSQQDEKPRVPDLNPVLDLAPEVELGKDSTPVAKEESDEAKIEAYLKTRPLIAPVLEPRKRKGWSPEARAAAAERMRARQAAGLMRRRGPEAVNESREPVEGAPSPILVRHRKALDPNTEEPSQGSDEHPDNGNESATAPVPVFSPADRWQPEPLSDEDWPDIRSMINAGSSSEKIAGDYDVPVEVLEDFVSKRLKGAQERHVAKEAVKRSGEA